MKYPFTSDGQPSNSQTTGQVLNRTFSTNSMVSSVTGDSEAAILAKLNEVLQKVDRLEQRGAVDYRSSNSAARQKKKVCTVIVDVFDEENFEECLASKEYQASLAVNLSSFAPFMDQLRDKVKLLCSEDESDLILEDELIAIQCVLNKLVKNSKTSERREYLNFLWSCYDSLPHSYVHPTDPTLCVFEDVERFDCNSLFARLGDVISKFLWMEGILPSVHVPGGTDLSVSLLDSDCIATEFTTRFNNCRNYRKKPPGKSKKRAAAEMELEKCQVQIADYTSAESISSEDKSVSSKPSFNKKVQKQLTLAYEKNTNQIVAV